MNIDWNYESYRSGAASLPDYHQSGWCFDGSAVKQMLAPHHDAISDASSVRLVDVYARPGKAIDLCYAFSARSGDVAAVTLRCSTGERGEREFDRARIKAADPTRIMVLDQATFAWLFPEDAGLPYLAPVQQGFENSKPGHGVKLLNYRRGERCTFLDLAAGAVSKIQPAAAQCHQRQMAIYHSSGRRFGMPEPMHCDDGNQMRTEQLMAGVPFGEQTSLVGVQAAAHSLINTLAGLHAVPVGGIAPALQPFHASHVMVRYESMFLRRLETANLPTLPICRTLGDELRKNIPPSPPSVRLLHGDMHSGNVLFHQGTASLIDLDEVTLGDPVYDLALFASDLVLMSVLHPDDRDVCLEAVGAIPDVYEAVAGVPIDRSSYSWHLAALIASRQIKTCINRAAPFIDDITSTLAKIALRIARRRDVTGAVLIGG